jgi:N-acyl-L-homoserine lactone synthetase
VYLQEAFTTQDKLNADGSETDADDKRSVHIGLIENDHAHNCQRMIGAMRLIVKQTPQDDSLPIEHHFPEVFEDAPAPPLSAEVSRLICRHEDIRLQTFCKWPLFTAGLTYANTHSLGPIYGVVTERLRRVLQHIGVPVTSLAEPRYIRSINATKLPVIVNTDGLQESINSDMTRAEVFSELQKIITKNFVYIAHDTLPATRR